MIHIANNGPRVVSTDYWSTEHAAQGLVYLSVNADAVRLLAPHGWPDVGDPRVTHASVQIVGAPSIGVAHVVLEDGTPSPAYLTIDVRQCDRALPAADLGRRITLLVYAPSVNNGVTLLRELPARIDVALSEPR